MTKKDVFTIAEQVALPLGLKYAVENRAIILSNGELDIILVPYTGNSNIVYLYTDVFRWDIASDEDGRADAINLINLGIDDCSMILLPPENETPNELRMIVKTEILLLSKEHFRKMLIGKINKLISTRTKYVDMLLKVNQQLGIEL